jgi:hypothetical protein
MSVSCSGSPASSPARLSPLEHFAVASCAIAVATLPLLLLSVATSAFVTLYILTVPAAIYMYCMSGYRAHHSPAPAERPTSPLSAQPADAKKELCPSPSHPSPIQSPNSPVLPEATDGTSAERVDNSPSPAPDVLRTPSPIDEAVRVSASRAAVDSLSTPPPSSPVQAEEAQPLPQSFTDRFVLTPLRGVMGLFRRKSVENAGDDEAQVSLSTLESGENGQHSEAEEIHTPPAQTSPQTPSPARDRTEEDTSSASRSHLRRTAGRLFGF